jgi:ATP-dependent protease HslVU (ClpYQ) peptidase subunit
MTCIVGVISKNNDIVMAGDSAGVAGFSMSVRKDDKVFVRDGYIIGFTTSFRMGQLLKYDLEILPSHVGVKDKDLHGFMVTDFIPAIKDVFERGGYIQETVDEDSKGEDKGGTFLVGTRGKLFIVADDFQVGESIHGFNSVGCGEDIALGALFGMTKIMPLLKNPTMQQAKAMAMIALESAQEYSAGVRMPFTLECLKNSGNPYKKDMVTSICDIAAYTSILNN